MEDGNKIEKVKTKTLNFEREREREREMGDLPVRKTVDLMMVLRMQKCVLYFFNTRVVGF
jgi:hypothetical protein